MSDIMVDLESVTKAFGEVTAVSNVNLQVGAGEFLTLLGPSGCGKTTTLRMIAGFEQPTTGLIRIDGAPVSGLPPYLRDVNTVFQNYALFPHMTVFENVAFGLRMKKVPGTEVEKRVNQALRMVQLEGYGKRRPKQLSGGQQQRVAVARAIVNNPKVLLLDEPLGALDLKLRKQMQVELKHLQRQLGITFIYVTHDQEEALTMSDRIAVMCGGEIIQLGGPADIYEKPRTRFVAGFIGEANIFEGKINYLNGATAVVDVQGLSITAPKTEGLRVGLEVCLSVRPEKAKFLDNPAGGVNQFSGRLLEHIYVGSIVKSVVELENGSRVVVESLGSSEARFLPQGAPVGVTWDPESTVLMRS